MFDGADSLKDFLNQLWRNHSPKLVDSRGERITRRKPRHAHGLSALVALFLVLTPYLFVATAAFAQTKPPQPGDGLPLGGGSGGGSDLTPQAAQTQPTSQFYNQPQTNYVTQAAEQNKDGVITNVENMLRSEMGAYNDTYAGISQFWSNDIVSNLFANIGQLIGKWITEFIDGWVADTVQFLTAFLRIFVLNPNIPVNGLNGNGTNGQQDDISPYIRQAADVMYGIAVDLLLLLFILCIWKYWAEASWRGGGNLMGAIGRLIFTAGLLLAWPTIYAFEIQITNEMIKAIYFNSADQVVMLDVAMAAAVKAGLLATAGGLAQAFAPVIGAVAGGAIGGGAGGMVLGTVGDIVSFAGLIIYLILGVVLITELVYFLVLKAIQTALLVAQYMFAPIFLVFFATPDTESTTSGYVRSFVEVSLWTFVWVGLLKILVIILYSSFNPWGKIIMAVGILQMMIQTPTFLARAQISPMSDFISAGMLTGGFLSGAKALGAMAQKRTGQLFDYMFNQQYAARGLRQSLDTNLDTLPTHAADPQLLTQIRSAATGKNLPGQPGTGPGTPPRNGENAQDLASPGLNVPGARPETPEERQQREALERQQRAAQYAAGLAAAGRTGATPPGGAPLDSSQPTANPNLNATPGVRNALAAGALVGTSFGVARALSDAGLARGITDPTTAGVPRAVQADPSLGQHLQDDIDKKFEHGEAKSGVINPASTYNHAGYKFVQAKIAAVDARTYNGNSIGYSDDGKNKLVGDGKGNLRHMRARKGASPEEVAHLVLAGGFTELFKDDAEAFDAARQSAIDAGEDAPKSAFERMGAGFLAYSGGTFKQTARAKERFGKSLFKHAALGSEAYVSGRPGNSYTQYLRTRFGDWSAKDDTWGVHIMTDAESPESPWNPKYAPATDSLFAVGLPISNENRAAATVSGVTKLPTWQRRQAIPAVATYMKEIASRQYPGADPIVRDAAIGRIASQMTNSEVEAAYAIQVESSGAEFAPDAAGRNDTIVPLVQTVAHLAEDPRCGSAGDAYNNLRTLVAQSTGVSGRRRGSSITVQAMLTQSAGPQPPIDPGRLGLGNLAGAAGQAPVVDRDVDVHIRSNADAPDNGGPVQHLVTNIPGGSAPPPQVYSDVRVRGDNGPRNSNPTQQRAEVEIHQDPPSGGGAPPHATAADIQHEVARHARTTGPIYQAAQLMIDMYNAGFNDTQIQNPHVAQMAHQYYVQEGQRHMLSTLSVAARILAPEDISADRYAGGQIVEYGTVETIQQMIDSGHNPNQIQRPDVWTAMSCRRANMTNLTPQVIRRWRLDERYVPAKGNPLPEQLPGENF